MNSEEYKLKSQGHSHFECDDCKDSFEIGNGGFLGSLDDFEFQMSNKDRLEEEFLECSPFMNYVQLCKKCYEQRGRNNKK